MRIEAILIDALGNEIAQEVSLEKGNTSYGEGSKKILKVNGNRTIRSKFIRNFYTVIFSPDSIDLITSSPSLRRRDLDEFLSVYDHDYLREITEYKKVIRNRNKLLEKCREGDVISKELNFWNKKLIDLGTKVIYKRIKFFKEINPIVLSLASVVFNSKDNNLSFEYISKFSQDSSSKGIRSALENKVTQDISKEIRAQVSLYGPHREDFRFILERKDLREYGSRGQQRLSAFLYKVAQWNILKEKFNIAPILLLDDLFSELDKKVCINIQDFLLDFEGQVILTALKRTELDKKFLTRVYEVEL